MIETVRQSFQVRFDRRLVAGALLTAGVAVAPLFVGDAEISFGTSVLAYIGFAMGIDLVWGYLGILSLGHAVFFGIGAYTVALLGTRAGVEDLFLLLPAAFGLSTFVAWLLGLFLFRGRRPMTVIYVAMATLAVAYVAEQVAHGWSWVGADTGISGLPFPTAGPWSLERPVDFYLLALLYVVVVYAVLRTMVNSPLGLVMAGIRGNERRLQFLGIRTGAYKTTLFALSGGIAGLAGAIYALNLGFASPTFLGVGLSTIAIIWVLTGGAGTLVGPILGVILIEYVSRELSGRFLGWWQVGLGIILLVVVLFLREGLVGVLRGSSRLGRPEKGKP